MIDRFRTAVAAASLCLTVSAAGAARLELATQPVIVISSDTPTATGTIRVRNAGPDALDKLEMNVGPFFTDPGNEPLPIAAKLTLPAKIESGATGDVTVELSNVTEPGYAKAELLNAGTRLGDLHMVKKVFAFNVAPVGYDGKQPFPVHLIQDEARSITLINTDPYPHSFSWSVRDADGELASGRVPLLRPNATIDIVVPGTCGGPLRWLEGTLLSPQSPARLLLRATGRGAHANDYWVAKDVPLQLSRTAGAGSGRDLWQLGLILVLLTAGGITSLYLTYWVPNTLKKLDIRAQIEDLTSKIHQLRRTPSTLRVLLSVLRNQLRSRLSSRGVLSPDFTGLIADTEQRVKALARSIALVQRIEYLLIDIEREWESGRSGRLGPTVLLQAEYLLWSTADQLERGELTEEEMRVLEAQVAQAEQDLRSTAKNDELIKQVVARAVKLQEKKAELQPLAVAAPQLAPALTESDASKVDWPAGLWRLDYAVTKMEIATLVAVKDAQDKLLPLLRLHSLEAFEAAVALGRRIREQVDPQTLKTALTDKKVRIVFHPLLPTVNDLVSFELQMDPMVAAAQSSFVCQWDFGDGLKEEGWRVSHYFARGGSFNVKAVVTESGGQPVEVGPEVVKAHEQSEKRLGTRSRLELIRLGIALLVVLLGLVAGAKEQIARLDLVPALMALFLLGVTADQIKNLLSPRAT